MITGLTQRTGSVAGIWRAISSSGRVTAPRSAHWGAADSYVKLTPLLTAATIREPPRVEMNPGIQTDQTCQSSNRRRQMSAVDATGWSPSVWLPTDETLSVDVGLDPLTWFRLARRSTQRIRPTITK